MKRHFPPLLLALLCAGQSQGQSTPAPVSVPGNEALQISGKALECGKPVAGATISVNFLSARGKIERSETTLSDGSYRLVIPHAKERFFLYFRNDPGEHAGHNEYHEINPGVSHPPVNLDWSWCHQGNPEAGLLYGFVAGDENEPLPGAIIRAKYDDWVKAAETDAAGGYKILFPEWATELEFTVSMDGMSTIVIKIIVGGRKKIRQDDRLALGSELEMCRYNPKDKDYCDRAREARRKKAREFLITLRGRVLDCGRRPLSGATVLATDGVFNRLIETDDRGKFNIAVPVSVKQLSLWAKHEGEDGEKQSFPFGRGRQEPHDLTVCRAVPDDHPTGTQN